MKERNTSLKTETLSYLDSMFSDDKKTLRAKLRSIRSSIKGDSRTQQDLYFFERIRDIVARERIDAVLTYISVNDEADTRRLIAYLVQNGTDVYVPKTYEYGAMEFYRVVSIDNLKLSFKSIPEPEESLSTIFQSNVYRNVLTIVPGLGFDRSGYRIGYGGGYYDRYIAKRKTEIGKTVGLCYSECLCDEIPRQMHDIPVDELICKAI